MATKQKLIKELSEMDKQLWSILDAYTDNLLSVHEMHKQVNKVLKSVKKENK